MSDFLQLLKTNRNYRYAWSGQVVSEIGDHFNNVAVFSLALANTRSGLVVTGIMLSRAIPAVMAGPLAGVVLDRLDRKRIMIVSDLIRAGVAVGFILAISSKSCTPRIRSRKPPAGRRLHSEHSWAAPASPSSATGGRSRSTRCHSCFR